jgi:hypothetical protein
VFAALLRLALAGALLALQRAALSCHRRATESIFGPARLSKAKAGPGFI